VFFLSHGVVHVLLLPTPSSHLKFTVITRNDFRITLEKTLNTIPPSLTTTTTELVNGPLHRTTKVSRHQNSQKR